MSEYDALVRIVKDLADDVARFEITLAEIDLVVTRHIKTFAKIHDRLTLLEKNWE